MKIIKSEKYKKAIRGAMTQKLYSTLTNPHFLPSF